MATIKKRGKNTFSVVYYYTDENGERKQKWETYHSYKEAVKRKAEVENQQFTGAFVSPSKQTVREFLHDFVETYGAQHWGVSMYDSCTALIKNYIDPIIGDMEVQSINARVVDTYIMKLRKTTPISTKTRKARTEFLPVKTIEKIIKLLSCAFKQAVRWELLGKNPFIGANIPKTEYTKRDIWDADTIRQALDACDDGKLLIAMHLAFACSLRMGEILGLTWDNVHIADDDLANDNAHICINKELARASKEAIEKIGEKDIYYTFPAIKADTTTRLVLKRPKTDSSIRKIWLPKTLAYILRAWKQSQDKVKELVGEEYPEIDRFASDSSINVMIINWWGKNTRITTWCWHRRTDVLMRTGSSKKRSIS